jgi:hypothetical protein
MIYTIYELMKYSFINLGTRLKFLFFLEIDFNIIHTFLYGIFVIITNRFLWHCNGDDSTWNEKCCEASK